MVHDGFTTIVIGALSMAVIGSTVSAEMIPYSKRWNVQLTSLRPEEILGKLDLSGPGLEAARAAAERGDRSAALAALLDHYRKKYPLPKRSKVTKAAGRRFKKADDIVNHVLQWGPYEPADYGKDVNWEWDPPGDIEWVAAVYRFHWASDLQEAYAATRDEKYGQAFVELTTDWIAKHPLEKRNKTHPVYKHWRGFAWLDIQTGIRATRICMAFPVLVHAKAFTPEFLGVLLASLYDHQVKTERVPMGIVHNKAVFEQRGFVNVAYTFREFKDARRWMKLALDRATENLLAQTTSDGVQREWSGGYHIGVLRDAEEIADRAATFDLEPSAAYLDRVRKMNDYLFWMATPDLGLPMFGDCSRSISQDKRRSRLNLYPRLVQASRRYGDPKYAARARLDSAGLPKQTSYAFPEAGMYVMRSQWGPEQIYFALHCSPPAITGHDQPDNGTFELYAYGRWLMTDTGFYTYGHDRKGRAWHRRTCVHQTLTLDGKDTKVAGKQRLWQTSSTFDAVVVENASYPKLLHRRSVWFVDRKFIVLLDEAIGAAKGKLDLHFQLAVGDVDVDEIRKCATTQFGDANILVWSARTVPVTLRTEQGWFAWTYGKRKPRIAFALRHAQPAPAAYLTVLLPYRGTESPTVSATLGKGFTVGADRVTLRVEAIGKTWQVGRDLARAQAWCKAE